MLEQSDCPACGYQTVDDENWMGVLGNRDHFRCRRCGWMWSAPAPEDRSYLVGLRGGDS